MPRTPPTISAPMPKLEPPENWTVHLQTITPMFGGGAETRQVDPEHPIRAASVRGHLRFWWRATAGAQYESADKLFEAESEIWGNTEMHGKVRVEVLCDGKPPKPVKASEIGIPSGRVRLAEGFFTYPYRQDGDDTGLREVQFQVHLHFAGGKHALSKESLNQVRTATRAWIAFGGVGGRTRRGCGALIVTEDVEQWLPRNPQELKEWFGQRGNALQRKDQPTLQSAIAFLTSNVSKEGNVETGVWRELGKFWTRFRKGHFVSRAEGEQDWNVRDGSRWFDHRTLLSLRLKGNSRRHSVQLCKPYLGLPIVYQSFRDSKTPVFSGTLEAVHDQGKRMASPVILKPCAFQDGVRGLILVLNAPSPREIKISGQEHDLEIPQHDPVLQALNVRSPLAAVGEAAKRCGYKTEVRL